MSKKLLSILGILILGITCNFMPSSFGQSSQEYTQTGNMLPSDTQIAAFKKTHRRGLRINWNSISAHVINQERTKKSLALVEAYKVAPMGQEIESVNDYAAVLPQSITLPTPNWTGLNANDLPANFDISTNSITAQAFPPLGNQSPTNECQSFASTYYQLTYMNAIQKGWTVSNGDRTKMFSPSFVYGLVEMPVVSTSNGVTTLHWGYGAPVTSALDVLQSNGAPTIAQFPFTTDFHTWDLNPNDWQGAISVRINPAQYLDASGDANISNLITQIEEWLVSGYVVTFGTFRHSWDMVPITGASSSNSSIIGGQAALYEIPQAGDGGHVMTIVGYDNNVTIQGTNEKGAFKVANSYGPVGLDGDINGYSWLSFDALYQSSPNGGPNNSGRQGAIYQDTVYYFNVRPNYSPKLVAKFTINVNPRNILQTAVGSSPISDNRPTISSAGSVYQETVYGLNQTALNDGQYGYDGPVGGAFAFDGTSSTSATSNTASFVVDMTDLLPSTPNTSLKYYLSGLSGSLLSYELIDLTTGQTYTPSTSLTLTNGISTPITYTYQGNTPPTAVITVDSTSTPSTISNAITMQFDCSKSSAYNGASISSCNWDFGDGTTGQGSLQTPVTHTFNNLSNNSTLFDVTLTVTDSNGGTGVFKLPAAVNLSPIPYPPVASATESTTTGAAPLQVTFNGSSSGFGSTVAPAGLSIVSYTWNFGDGSNPITCTNNPNTDPNSCSGSSVTHSYTILSNEAVDIIPSLKVTDNRGMSTTAALGKIVISKVSSSNSLTPLFSVTPTTGIADQTVFTFNGSTSIDKVGTITTYNWNFGDGSNIITCTVGSNTNPSSCSGSSVTYTYPSAGRFGPSLEIQDIRQDNQGNTLTFSSTWYRFSSFLTVSTNPNPTTTAPMITTQPANTTVAIGSTASFSAAASGNPTPTYQWMLSTNSGSSWSNISGATSATLSLSNTTTSMNGYEYELVATNSAGSVTSNAATLTVNSTYNPPNITAQPPSSTTITAGSSTTLTITASGTTPLSYQWYQNGTAIPEASGSSFTSPTTITYTTPTTLTTGSYTYTITVSNTNGNSNTLTTVTSDPSNLNVNAATTAPVITTQPVNTTVTAGATATFTAAASGNPTPTYQWMQRPTSAGTWTTVSGATSTTLTITNTTTSMSGYQYKLVATNSVGSATSNPATLTVNAATAAPVITTQPVNSTVTAGATATFTAAASGTPTPTYQWMQRTTASSWSTVLGATSTTLTITNTTTSMSGNQYELVATNSAGSATSNPATLTVNATTSAPVFTTQPVNVTVTAGATATFTAAASGTPTPTYQWMQRPNSAGAWTTVSGATSTTLTISNTTTSMSGYQYKIVATNSAGSATSNTATLTVNAANSAPVITTQPVNTTVTAGATATFTAAASGNPTPTYQWMQRTSSAGTWTTVGGATSTTLTISHTTTSMSGYQYELVATNSAGSATSNPATLTVNAATAAPVITTQPVNSTVTAGATATFTAAASGTPTPTYQWMQRTTASSWSTVLGATSTTLTISHATTSMNGNQYELVATNSAGSATSNPATLTVNATTSAPVFTTQPVNATVTAGATATFTAAASGNPAPTYQWMQKIASNNSSSSSSTAVSAAAIKTLLNKTSSSSNTWAPINGATSSTLTLTNTTTSMNGNQYELIATNSVGSVTSNPAILTVNSLGTAPVITSQPASTTVTAGATAYFMAAASGSPAPTYQWLQSTNRGSSWTAMSNQIESRLILSNTTSSMNGNEYKVVATNSAGSATSNPVTLTVNSLSTAPVITTQPINTTVTAGATATFTAAASGNPAPTYQWMQRTTSNSTWSPVRGATTTTLTLTSTTTSMNGNQYELVATNSVSSATSNPATLTVNAAAAGTPIITTQPASTTVTEGTTARFLTAASGTPAPTYQWLLSTDGGITWTSISGANSSRLSLSNTTITMNGNEYEAVATNSVGSVTSNKATLTVIGNSPCTAQTLTSGFCSYDMPETNGGQSATVYAQGISYICSSLEGTATCLNGTWGPVSTTPWCTASGGTLCYGDCCYAGSTKCSSSAQRCVPI